MMGVEDQRSAGVSRFALFLAAVLLCIPALYCLLVLTFVRTDTTEQFLYMRSCAYWHALLWPLAFGVYKLSRPPKETPENTWLSQTFGNRGAAAIESVFGLLLVAFLAWYVSMSAMRGEYSRMQHPEKYHDWLYRIAGF